MIDILSDIFERKVKEGIWGYDEIIALIKNEIFQFIKKITSKYHPDFDDKILFIDLFNYINKLLKEVAIDKSI